MIVRQPSAPSRTSTSSRQLRHRNQVHDLEWALGGSFGKHFDVLGRQLRRLREKKK